VFRPNRYIKRTFEYIQSTRISVDPQTKILGMPLHCFLIVHFQSINKQVDIISAFQHSAAQCAWTVTYVVSIRDGPSS